MVVIYGLDCRRRVYDTALFQAQGGCRREKRIEANSNSGSNGHPSMRCAGTEHVKAAVKSL